MASCRNAHVLEVKGNRAFQLFFSVEEFSTKQSIAQEERVKSAKVFSMTGPTIDAPWFSNFHNNLKFLGGCIIGSVEVPLLVLTE